MIEAGVRKLKDHLSAYLRRAQKGERVVITDRGRPIAALVGLPQEEATELTWRLVHGGLVDWGGGKPSGSSHPPRVPGRRAEEVVIEDRR